MHETLLVFFGLNALPQFRPGGAVVYGPSQTSMKRSADDQETFRAIRKHLRHGEYSRMPLQLRRCEIALDAAECEWFMRPPDPWDIYLPPRVRQEHATIQAMLDALKMRELIFRAFPRVQSAELRTYREWEAKEPALMMAGSVQRETEVSHRIVSLVMQARLFGFRFSLEGGVLEKMPDPKCP
jgi:hypothetical protein